MSHFWQVKTRDQAKEFCSWITLEQDAGREHLYEISKPHRSTKQNAALHSMFRRLAKELVEAGHEIEHPLNKERTIPWTENSVKELLYKPVIGSMYGSTTTTKLTTEQLSKSVEIMLNRVAEITGVVVGFTLQEHALLRGE